jgi:hypothetical protein
MIKHYTFFTHRLVRTGGTSVSRFLLELTQRGLFGRFARIDEAWLNSISAHMHRTHTAAPPHHRTRAKLAVPEGISRQTFSVGGLNCEMMTMRSSSPSFRTIAMMSTAVCRVCVVCVSVCVRWNMHVPRALQ